MSNHHQHHSKAMENQLIYNTTAGSIVPGYVNNTMTNGHVNSDDARRPKPVFFWTNGEVMKWLKRHCEEFYESYGHVFLENEITGRTLVRLTPTTLARMGVDNDEHCDEMVRTIIKLKLKSDIIELKEIERRTIQQSNNSGSLNNLHLNNMN
ncbi:hypothetical protein RDWZM_004240 [Blomia tropicalis]|uniref:SAM domain-containing protein n=1 Tax=Blomia tropicalis TaxID=40697 RepID=A0A9Q0MKT6_BLOTA|nr:SAM domain (Sterile alpha motif) [Blomia tropicalis]KAJ6225695.1 hypothetical protein RDWZM_004240 [Blomia tropicalis]